MQSDCSPQKIPADTSVSGRWWLGLIALWFGVADAPAMELRPVLAVLPGVPAPVPEYNAKAGYLLRFTRYVEWPAEMFANPTAPLVIGVLGVNPFGDALDRTVRGLKSQGRPIEVRYVQTAEEAARCQVVFIARQQERDESVWLRALHGKPVLTLTESEQGIAEGAVLSFVLEKELTGIKVRFDASLPAAHAARLQLGADMLRFARKVYRESAEAKVTP